MSETTKIAWTDSTANIVIGCTKVSEGCKNCFAANDTPARVLRHRGIETWGEKGQRVEVKGYEKTVMAMNRKPWIGLTGNSYTENERQDHLGGDIFHWRRIFHGSNNDWLDLKWPIELLAKKLDVIRRATECVHILCTKRPENFEPRLQSILDCQSATGSLGNDKSFFHWIVDWLEGNEFPPNIILLTSVENPDAKWRITELQKIPAACRGISFEPLIAAVKVQIWDGISWAIIGCESGSKRRPCDNLWTINLVEQAQAAGVKVFVKQISINGKVSHDTSQWPERLQVQEWPKL
jgi:protein gp37